jgi:hypothetical protein
MSLQTTSGAEIGFDVFLYAGVFLIMAIPAFIERSARKATGLPPLAKRRLLSVRSVLYVLMVLVIAAALLLDTLKIYSVDRLSLAGAVFVLALASIPKRKPPPGDSGPES